MGANWGTHLGRGPGAQEISSINQEKELGEPLRVVGMKSALTWITTPLHDPGRSSRERMQGLSWVITRELCGRALS